MSLRWPALELLRRGDLIALSPLSQTASRLAMTDALHRLQPAFAHFNARGPDVAVIEALAACVEVMGFYHDRFLTESKLGSAQRLDDLGKIVALIGYRPLPEVAATAYQFFEAVAAGSVAAGTRVAGKVVAPPSTVTFETDALLEVSPEQNRMALSPLLTRSAGALRAVVTQLIAAPEGAAPAIARIAGWQSTRGTALPTDDFRRQTIAMVADVQGLELAPVGGSRSRGVAFGRPLSRSFDPASALVSRTTVIRRLTGPRAVADDLVAFEVSEAPILHLPSVGAPELLTSTLEVFVLRPGDEALDPSQWDPALRYQEVSDFSGSEVSDLHYRTFVDDALHTWIALRAKLGAQPLLDDAALQRVHVRFVPAVGSVLDDVPAQAAGVAPAQGPSPAPDLTGVTLGLEAGYFETSLVLPPVANTRLGAGATWAMVDRDLGLVAGDSILLQDEAGGRWARTLLDRPPGASARLLRWAADPPAFTPASAGLPEAHDPVDRALDPAGAKIGSLTDAANGDVFPTWSEFYAQLKAPGPFEPATDLPLVPSSPTGVIARQRVVAAGTTYLVLGDASHVSVGDFLLLGRRLTQPLRALQPFGDWRYKPGEPPFDPRAPWLDAEVVQALEVRGNVVRLATPVSQEYFVHQGRLGTRTMRLSEVIALPGVVSVASGDRLHQVLNLSTQPRFQGKDEQLYDASYVSAALDVGAPAGALRRPLRPDAPVRPEVLIALLAPPARAGRAAPVPPGAQGLWNTLFVAVAGVAEAQTDALWSFDVVVRTAKLRAPAEAIDRLEDGTGLRLTGDGIAGALASELKLRLTSVEAAARVAGAADRSVVAVLATPAVWRVTSGAPAAGQFRVRTVLSFDVLPDPRELIREDVLGEGGTLVIVPQTGTDERTFAFSWDPVAEAPRVEGAAPAVSDPFEALLVSAHGADLRNLVAATQGVGRRSSAAPITATADWLVPGSRFGDPAFVQLALGTPPAGTRVPTLVAATADDTIALECRFAGGDGGLELDDVPLASIVDPLSDAETLWAVLPGDARLATAQARWDFELAHGDPSSLPPSADVRLALVGARRELVDAHTSDDGRSAAAIVDPERGVRGGDLGFALDALCVLEGKPLEGERIAESTIWAWQGIDPPLTDLPGPSDSRFVAVLASRDDTVQWPRADVWWDPERRTLRLPTARLAAAPGARPSDVVRLLQVLAPHIDRRHFTVQYDRVTDRSILTMELAPGWPGRELAPAPVVVATPAHRGPIEVRDMIAPVEVFTDPEGRVRWTMHFAGDLRKRWTDVGVVLRDWSAPAERGLAAVPLWRVTAPAAWRARVAADPVTLPVMLIVRTRDGADFLALAAMPRLDGDALELAPLGRDDEFPVAASVAKLDLATRAIAATARAPLALRGSTVLELGAAAGGEPPHVTHVVFEDGPRWQPIEVTGTTALVDGGQRYELGRAYLSLFPEGLPSRQRVRLCYAMSPLPAATVPAKAVTLRLRLPALAHGVGANAAVLHDDDKLGHRIVLDTRSTPTVDGDALVVELALDADGLGKVFDEHGNPRRNRLDLASRWSGTIAKTLERQPLRVELGSQPPYALAENDVVRLGFPAGDPVTAEVRAVGPDGLLDLVTTATLAPSTIALYGLRTPIATADYSATLDLLPSSQQAPWLLSFANDPDPTSLLDTLLPYAATEVEDDGAGRARRRFRFACHPKLADIFLHAGEPLYLFSNERGELRSDFYTGSDDKLAKDLRLTPPPNFLDAPEDTVIDRLVLTSSAWAGKNLDRPRPVVLCSTAWTPPGGEPGMPPDRFPELKIVSATPGRVATSAVLQSTRFNSGNFIPVAGQGTTPANAAALIASALRVSAQPVDRAGNAVDRAGKPLGRRTVRYVALDALSAMIASIAGAGAGTALEAITLSDAFDAHVIDGDDTRYVFSASFSSAGVCTLHFLFIDDALIETVRVQVEAQYEVNPGRTGNGLADPIYPLETEVAPFDPGARLALLAPGQLKPEALVFVRMPRGEGVPALQWTRVTGVTGPLVDVAPPIAYAPAAGAGSLEPIEVTALGKLERAAKLDADYYQTVAKAKLVPSLDPDPARKAPAGPDQDPPGWWALPLRDRLPLDVVARPTGSDASLVASLIPGDLVLVFDDRQRQAWAARRRGGAPEGSASTADWRQWPDFQHQAVVKRVDADTGLLVLGAPLPDRFQIRWRLDAKAGRLDAHPDDVAALRVLPHYRAPVQGRRTLAVLGSGDATQRFARFTSSLDAAVGSAVLPLAADGVMTGNLEVLSYDPEKAAWTRWLRYDKLSRAGKKDPAFVLGFRPADAVGQVPISATFGDGLTGQLLPTGTGNVYLRSTRIGAAASHLAQRRPVRTREVTAGPVEVATRSAPVADLKLRLECTAPAELSGSSDLGSAQWRPTLELTVTMPDRTARDFHEISQDDAVRGASGFLVVSDPDMPPGVVDAYVYSPLPLDEHAPVTAWQVPGTRQWALDDEFYSHMPDLTVGPGATSLQLLSTTGLRAGSFLALFPDKDSPPNIMRLASVHPPTWSATVEQPLPRAYDLERSFIRGNVVRIVQGAVERTTIGSSDGSTRSLRLPLHSRSLLHVVEPGKPPAPGIEVRVSDQTWTRVLDFAGQTPASRVWRLDVDPDGTLFVVFGDGTQGAIPPAGRDHIEAIVRGGSGATGNLAAGAIDKLVTGNLAVKSTASLTPSAGGSARDTPAAAREKAFARRLPSDRVVSAGDCVRAALGVSGVLTAALDPTAAAGALKLVVALDGRRTPTAEDLAAVHDQVAGAMPATAGVRLEVAAADQRAVHLVVELGVEGSLPGEVFAQVTRAFGAGPDGFFAADRWDVGEPLRLGAIYDAIFRVPGVAHARVLWMADTPLLDGVEPSGPAPDVFDPGATGVVRCDNDPIADPFGRNGSFRIQQASEVSA